MKIRATLVLLLAVTMLAAGLWLAAQLAPDYAWGAV